MNKNHILKLKNGDDISAKLLSVDFLKRELIMQVETEGQSDKLFSDNFNTFSDELDINVDTGDINYSCNGLFFKGWHYDTSQYVKLCFYISQIEVPEVKGNVLFVIPIKFLYIAHDASCKNFSFNGRFWQLSNAEKVDENALFLNSAKSSYSQNKLVLSTNCEGNSDINDIIGDAISVCRLMSFAFGTRFMWSYAWAHVLGRNMIIAYSNRALNKGQQYACVVQNAPNNYQKVALGDFVQCAEKKYLASPKWFNYIIEWYMNVQECDQIEVKLMICSMLLETISRKYVRPQGSLIGDTLGLRLKNKSEKEKLRSAINDIMSFENAWKPDHSNVILQKMSEMNSNYSYLKSIECFFAIGGRCGLDKQEKDILKSRNTLMHHGFIFDKNVDVCKRKDNVLSNFEYFVNTCRCIILALLGYSGRYGKLDRTDGDAFEYVSSIFKNWKDLAKLNVRDI